MNDLLVLAALGLTVVPDEWVSLLGLVPLALGVRGLVRTWHARHTGEPPTALSLGGVLPVTGMTVANGADNISIYTPLFRTIGWSAWWRSSTGGATGWYPSSSWSSACSFSCRRRLVRCPA